MTGIPIEPMEADGSIRIHPIGVIRSGVSEQRTGGFERLRATIELRPDFREFLDGLAEYSHLIVLYWLSEQTQALPVTRPQGHPDVPFVGMFACR